MPCRRFIGMHPEVERIIRENPTQWLWFQKRWNTPPDEKKERHHVIKSEGAEHE